MNKKRALYDDFSHQHRQTLANQHAPQMAPIVFLDHVRSFTWLNRSRRRHISADTRPRTSSWLCSLLSGYGVMEMISFGNDTKLTDVADVADQRPAARDLLEAFFPQPAHALQGPRNGITLSSFGVSSPLTNQVNGTTTIYSAAPAPMEWTRPGATAIFQGRPWPMRRNESTQLSQLSPVAAQSPKVPPNRQPGIRRKGSVKSAKSVDERQKKSHKRGGSSQNTPSQSAGVPKRTSSSRR